MDKEMAKLGISVACLLAVMTAATPANAQQAGASEARPAAVAARGSVLFDNFSGIEAAPGVVTSQNFTDPGLGGFQTAGADDFTVTGNAWQLNSVDVRGGYFPLMPGGNEGPAASVNLYILGNSGSLPDTTNLSAGAIYAVENLAYSDAGSGDFQITLPGSGVLLQAGTYWLVVQANMEAQVAGQWGWTESATSPGSGLTNGSESAWFQNQALVGGSCVNAWGARVTTCGIVGGMTVPSQRDLAFRLIGSELNPGIQVNRTSLTTSESGTVDSFTVVLSAPPLGGNTVSVPIGSPDPTEGSVSPGMLSFNAANWDIPQTVTVTGLDDAVADGNVMYTLANGPAASGDGGYDNLAVASVDVTNLDDESAGFIVDPVSGLQVSEDGTVTASFTVRLTTTPSASVNLPLSVNPPSAATLDTANLTLNNTSPQTVTITGVDDDIDNGDMLFSVVTGDPSSIDAVYDAFGAGDVPDISATRLDDDTAGVVVNPTSGLVTTEAGGTDTFEVVLNSEPLADVSIALSVGDATEGMLSLSNLTFTSANWNTPQTVTVTGVDDAIADGDVTYAVNTGPAASTDGTYDQLAVDDVFVVNQDDENAAITVTPTAGLVTSEAGATDSFTVVLEAEPSADVSVALSVSDATEGAVNPSAVVFTNANWDTPQTVTVSGVDDAVVDGDQAYTVLTAPAVSADMAYNGIDADDVTATNSDDDNAGISINDVSVIEGTGGNTTATFTVALDTAVDGGFSVDFSSADGTAMAPADYTAAVGTLSFAGNLNETQQINVTVLGDSDVEADETFLVNLGTPSNPAVTATDGTGLGTIVDDDGADLSLTLSAAPDPVIAGTQLTYTATVDNTGPANADGVSVSLTVPAGTSIVSGSVVGSGSCVGIGPVQCSFSGPVMPGTPRSATVTVDVAASLTAASLSASATATSSSFDPNLTNNTATVTTQLDAAADLSMIMTIVPAEGMVGDFFVLTATATNGGPSDAQDVQLDFVIPQGLLIISSTPDTGGTCAVAPPAGGSVDLSCLYAGPTPSGSQRSVQALLQANAPGLIVVNAQVSSATTDPIANNNTVAAGVATEVLPVPALTPGMLVLLMLLLGGAGGMVVRLRD